ncbi:MAG TPA: response regulator [Candidatus Dormibacteraeota bacterium]
MGAPNPISVMLVEDDASIAELYSMKLRMDGYAVHLAADATAADVIFQQASPQVVCVDSRLPDSSGRGTAERFAGAGAIVLLLTNDQESYENPPPGVARSLLKSRTNPGQLSYAIAQLVGAKRR